MLQEKLPALIFGQEFQLLLVDSAPPLSPNQIHGILVLHTEFDQGHGHQDRGPAQTGDAMHTYAHVGIILERCAEKI